MVEVNITVNGIKHKLEVDDKETLLEVLRERLDLTGAKNGCGYGTCGACTVVVDGKAQRSCILRPPKYDGKEIITIEGVSDGHKLHPIQEALIEVGAVQCGFCTPGIVMSLYALYNENVDAFR